MENIVDILKRVNAVITNGHFVFASGRHSDTYVNKNALYVHTEETSKVCQIFAEKNKDLDIEVVVGPALGGIILSQWTAWHLSKIKGKEILSVYTEKNSNEDQVFKRDYDKLVKGKNVLVVEDITTTGSSIKKAVNEVREVGGNVLMVCAMINRNPDRVTAEVIGAPFSYLGAFEAEDFEESECPMCKNNIPINTNVGHGKKYLEQKNANN
ncbi:phosphoribosyltransferase [Patescibacteria group bacterium]|nr:phosphoribosyltransferase [Patescibacteria group bacterium]